MKYLYRAQRPVGSRSDNSLPGDHRLCGVLRDTMSVYRAREQGLGACGSKRKNRESRAVGRAATRTRSGRSLSSIASYIIHVLTFAGHSSHPPLARMRTVNIYFVTVRRMRSLLRLKPHVEKSDLFAHVRVFALSCLTPRFPEIGTRHTSDPKSRVYRKSRGCIHWIASTYPSDLQIHLEGPVSFCWRDMRTNLSQQRS